MPKNLGLYEDDLSTPRKKDVDACYGPNNVPPYPVTSVNKETGAVVLDASDVNAVAKTGDSMTGTLTVGSASLETNGYVTGTWFKTTANTALSTKPSKIAVINDGWIYSRTPEQIKNDIGLNNVDNIKQYSASNPPPYPVTSVNGQTGGVNLTASDVGAVPTSRTVNGKALNANIKLAASDVGSYSKSETNTLLKKKADKDRVVNPNLLDNWYFGNPVNQRNVSGTIDAVGYFLDRWKLVSGIVTIGSNGITLNGTIVQILEEAVGTDVTASALTVEGVVVASYDNNSKTISLTGTGQTFVAAKLELGTHQTLAHQDANGNWVLNEIPDYGEQLARCQRYYLGNKQRNAYGKSTSTTAVYVDIPTPVTMRALPAVKIGALGRVICNGVKATIKSINPVKLNDESITLHLVLKTSVSVDYPVLLTDTNYALSADL